MNGDQQGESDRIAPGSDVAGQPKEATQANQGGPSILTDDARKKRALSRISMRPPAASAALRMSGNASPPNDSEQNESQSVLSDKARVLMRPVAASIRRQRMQLNIDEASEENSCEEDDKHEFDRGFALGSDPEGEKGMEERVAIDSGLQTGLGNMPPTTPGAYAMSGPSDLRRQEREAVVGGGGRVATDDGEETRTPVVAYTVDHAPVVTAAVPVEKRFLNWRVAVVLVAFVGLGIGLGVPLSRANSSSPTDSLSVPTIPSPVLTVSPAPTGAPTITQTSPTNATISTTMSPFTRNGFPKVILISTELVNFCGHENYRARQCGGHLVSITNDDEVALVEALVDHYYPSGQRVWLGGFQSETNDTANIDEGGWGWSDGSSWFCNDCWATGQPDNKIIGGKGQHHLFRNARGKWRDENGCAGYRAPKAPGVYILPLDYDTKYPECNTAVLLAR